MNEFFGISMTYIMIGLLAILALALASVGWVVECRSCPRSSRSSPPG